jgi:hypothetical protein
VGDGEGGGRRWKKKDEEKEEEEEEEVRETVWCGAVGRPQLLVNSDLGLRVCAEGGLVGERASERGSSQLRLA